MPLIVTGSVGIDSVEAPSGTAVDVLGGSAVYFAAAASFFGPVRLVAAVGEDAPPELERILDHFGVDRTGLERRAGSQTFRWSGRYLDDMNQRETVSVDLNVLAESLPPVPEAYRDSRHIFLANTDPGSQFELLQHFPDRAIAVADTMDLWINIARDELLELFKKIDGLIINDAEAEQLTEITNPITAARAIIELGPAFVIVKKGEHGAVLVHKEGIAVLPAYPLALEGVVDPTGAGDSFAGGFMGYLAASDHLDFNTMQRAMAWGTVTASFTLGSFGLDGLAATSNTDLEVRMQEFKQMAMVDSVIPE